MACNDPLRGFVIWINGQREIKVTGRNIDHLELYDDGVYRQVDNGLISPYCKKYVSEYIDIPCGRCMGCRLDYSKMWADRMMLELQYHDNAYFLTLTYNDDNLPEGEYIDDEGVINKSHSLIKRDLQLFIKRLRKSQKNKLMYYACGEYGDKSARPHYHAIIYSLDIPDLMFYKKGKKGYNYYTSEYLNSVWQLGYVIVGQVSYDTCAYTARYITKKQYGKGKEKYERLGIEPEFATMSLRPAIGLAYYQDNMERIASLDSVSIPTAEGGRQIRPSKYYYSKLEQYDKEMYLKLKEKNETYLKNKKKIVNEMSDLEYYDILEVQENTLKARTKVLRKETI